LLLSYSPSEYLPNGHICFVFAMIFKHDISSISKKGKEYVLHNTHPDNLQKKQGFLKIEPSHDIADNFLVFGTHEI